MLIYENGMLIYENGMLNPKKSVLNVCKKKQKKIMVYPKKKAYKLNTRFTFNVIPVYQRVYPEQCIQYPSVGLHITHSCMVAPYHIESL